MKLLSTALFLLGLSGLSACKPDKDAEAPATIVGRWQLTELQCFCGSNPLPNETVEFSADGTVVYYKNGQVDSQGTYSFTTGNVLCYPDNGPVVRLTGTPFYAGDAAYTIESTELVLDYGTCLDLPRKVYQRD